MKRILLAMMLMVSVVFASESIWGSKLNEYDPVYAIKILQHPKFSTHMVLKNGKKIDFCCVKAMMNFYFHPERCPGYGVKSRKDIANMYVKDYLSGKKINARKAWYVFGSKVIGPHGDDLIPLSSKERAKLFVKKYGGARIIPIKDFTYGLIHFLDM